MAVRTPCGYCYRAVPGIVGIAHERGYPAKSGRIMLCIVMAVVAGGVLVCPVGRTCAVPDAAITDIG